MGIFVERVTPFFPEFLEKFLALDYPKSRMSLFIHRDGDWHNEELREFLSNEVKEYAKVEVKSSDDLIEWKARNTALYVYSLKWILKKSTTVHIILLILTNIICNQLFLCISFFNISLNPSCLFYSSQYCLDNECEYYLNLDAQAHLTNKKVNTTLFIGCK